MHDLAATSSHAALTQKRRRSGKGMKRRQASPKHRAGYGGATSHPSTRLTVAVSDALGMPLSIYGEGLAVKRR